jgi:hypothetical protein
MQSALCPELTEKKELTKKKRKNRGKQEFGGKIFRVFHTQSSTLRT